MADFMQISKNGLRQTDTNNPRQRLKLVEFNTIRRKRANRTSGPMPDLLQILAKWTASEKWSIVNEILIGNLMKIASDCPTADFYANKENGCFKQTTEYTTKIETRRTQYYTSQMRKSDKRPCGRFDVNFGKWTASEKWSIVHEIL